MDIEERYQLLSEAALEGIAITDQGKIITVNDAFLKATGYDSSGVIGHPAIDFVAPECRDLVSKQMSSGFEEPYEALGLRKDGTTFPEEIVGHHITFQGGNFRVTVLRDLTKRKQAEAALRESEIKYESLIRALPDAVTMTDMDGNLTYVSPRAVELYGAESDEELLGKSIFDITVPEDHEKRNKNFQRLLQNGLVLNAEYTLYRKDKTRRTAEISTALLKDANGKPKSIISVIRDITDKKQAEQALRESEANLRIFAENANDGIIIPDSTGAFVFANRRASEITGYSIEELLSMTMRDLAPPEEIERLFNNLKNRLKGEPVPTSYETLLRRKDGTIRPIEMAASVTTWKGQSAAPAIFRDITERKYAEELLKESESKYRTLVEKSLQGILIARGIPPRILYANSALADILGYSVKELQTLVPEEIKNLIHPEDQEIFFGRYQERLQGKSVPSRYEIRAVRKDGSLLWVELLSSRIIYQGKPAVQAVYIDRTERKLVEDALRESETRYREIASSIPGVVYQALIKKDGSISLLFVSEGTRELYGLEPEEVQADMSKMFDIIDPEDLDKYKQMVTETRNNLGDLTLELRMKLKTGELKWIRVVSRPHLLLDGSIIRNGVVYDITEHKWVEEQVRRYSEELEEKVKERTEQIRNLERRHADSEKLAATGRMAARIAHEINNPLAGIKNSFLLVKDAISPKHPYYKYVGIIEKEIDRIARIVHRTFDLYRPDQEAPKKFSISAVIGDIVALLEPSASKSKIEFEVKVPETPITVTLQEGYLTQVLFNVINNAIEASPMKGIIKINAILADQVLTIVIVDQGCGIPEEIRSNIFEPFFTTKSHQATGGLGLGLSVSKSMVEAMGGNIDFETETGKGTVFRISVPLPDQVNTKSSKSTT